MRILGIDPGLARVGYGVIDIQDGCQRMLDCGIIQTDSGRSDGDRMVEIAGDLRQLIRIWRPELAAVEKFFFYRFSNTINVVQARGVVVMTLARFKIPMVEFPPMQIKLAVAGFGHAEKDEVLEAVTRTTLHPSTTATATEFADDDWADRELWDVAVEIFEKNRHLYLGAAPPPVN